MVNIRSWYFFFYLLKQKIISSYENAVHSNKILELYIGEFKTKPLIEERRPKDSCDIYSVPCDILYFRSSSPQQADDNSNHSSEYDSSSSLHQSCPTMDTNHFIEDIKERLQFYKTACEWDNKELEDNDNLVNCEIHNIKNKIQSYNDFQKVKEKMKYLFSNKSVSILNSINIFSSKTKNWS